MYSIDTSVLLDWQSRYYPLDVFETLKVRLERLVQDEQARCVELVREELGAVAPPATQSWAKAQRGLFVPLDEALQAEGAAIEGQFPDLADPKGIHQSADAWVIALAKREGWTVVSQETPASEKKNPRKNHFIPDACRELGIPCISLLGLMRQQGWRF